MNSTQTAVETLEKAVQDHAFLDVGRGTEAILGISPVKLREALNVLRQGEYTVHTIKYSRTDGTHTITTLKVLTSKENTWNDARQAVANGYLHHLEEKK